MEDIEELSDFKESACVLLERFRVGYFAIIKKWTLVSSVGSYSKVELKDEEWGKTIEDREDKYQDVAGFFHVHPPDAEWISGVDTATARGFSFAFGKRMLMIIGNESGWYQAWYVNSDGVVAQAKILKLPFDYFLVWIP